MPAAVKKDDSLLRWRGNEIRVAGKGGSQLFSQREEEREKIVDVH